MAIVSLTVACSTSFKLGDASWSIAIGAERTKMSAQLDLLQISGTDRFTGAVISGGQTWQTEGRGNYLKAALEGSKAWVSIAQNDAASFLRPKSYVLGSSGRGDVYLQVKSVFSKRGNLLIQGEDSRIIVSSDRVEADSAWLEKNSELSAGKYNDTGLIGLLLLYFVLYRKDPSAAL